MANLNTDKYVCGAGTLVFNGNTIAYAQAVDIACEPGVIEAPDVLAGAGPVGFVVPKRGITVTAKINTLTADVFCWATGWPTSVSSPGEPTVIDLDEAQVQPAVGSLTLTTTLVDGTPVRLHLKRATAVPTSQTITIGKDAFAEMTIQFAKCDPGDGTRVAGDLQIG